MKKGYTDITFILDKSGSMSKIKNDTIGGFNSFIEEQKRGVGEAKFSLVQFSDSYEMIYSGRDINAVEPLRDETFIPSGWTALLDAIGRTIKEQGERFEKMTEDKRPETVIIVILTDGEENRSRKYNSTEIHEMITQQREVYNWQFIFLGANQDAIATASSVGIPVAAALTYDHSNQGIAGAMASVSLSVHRARLGTDAVFTKEDRELQNKLIK